jgi:hypothetical protein
VFAQALAARAYQLQLGGAASALTWSLMHSCLGLKHAVFPGVVMSLSWTNLMRRLTVASAALYFATAPSEREKRAASLIT